MCIRDSIKQTLDIPAAGEFIASFDRENLFLEVAAKTDGLRQAGEFLAAHRGEAGLIYCCLLYTSPSPRDRTRSRMPASALKKKKKTREYRV